MLVTIPASMSPQAFSCVWRTMKAVTTAKPFLESLPVWVVFQYSEDRLVGFWRFLR